MTNRKCKIGKKSLAARKIAAILMTSTFAGTLAVGAPGAFQVTAEAQMSNADYIFEYLTKRLGYNEAAACGIMANIRCESTFNPHAWNAGGGSYGLCQWTGGRYGRLQSWCRSNGYDYTTIDGQLAYLEYELNTYYTSVENYLRSVENTADGAYNAGQYYCYHFEAPASRGSVSHYRGGLASGTFWETYRPAEWYEEDSKWRYIKRDGSYHTSWLTIDNKTYYLDENGYRVSGWKTIDGKRYYFDKNGVMSTGWVKIDGKNYYFDEDGFLITGLVHGGGDWYLVNQDGEIKSSNEMGDFAEGWVPPSQAPDDISLASADGESGKETASADSSKETASADSSKETASADSSKETASASGSSTADGSTASADAGNTSGDSKVALSNGFLGTSNVSQAVGGISDDSSKELPANTTDGAHIAGLQKSTEMMASSASQTVSIASINTAADEETVSDKEEAAETSAAATENTDDVSVSSESAEAETTEEAAEIVADTSDAAEEENAEKAVTKEAAEETIAEESSEKAAEKTTEEVAEETTKEAAAEETSTKAASEDTSKEVTTEEAAAKETTQKAAEDAEEADDAEDAVEESEDSEIAGQDADQEEASEVSEVSESSNTGEYALSGDILNGIDSEDLSGDTTIEKAEEFLAADALRAAAEAINEVSEEEDSEGFFMLYEPNTVENGSVSATDILPGITSMDAGQEKSSITITLEEDDLPSIKRSDMDKLAEILAEKDLLNAVAEDGKDITKDVKVTYEKVSGKSNVYKVTFTVQYKGEKAERKSEVTVVD